MSPRRPAIRRPPPPPPPVLPLSLYRKIGVSFVIVTVLLLILVITVTTARATISIILKTVPVEVQQSVTISRTPSGDEIKGVMSEVAQNSEREVAIAEGVGAAVPAKAHGVVTLQNTTSRNQPLVATTRLLAKTGVLFRITKSVVVPAQGEVKVEAAADEPGKAGEIGPTKFTIPGLAASLQDKIFGESSEPMRGGEARTGVVRQEEVDAAVSELLVAQGDAGRRELSSSSAAAAFSGNAWRSDVISREVTPAVGSKAGRFTIKVKVRVQGVFFDREALLITTRKALLSRVPPGTTLKDIDISKFVIRVDKVDVKLGVTQATIQATGNTQAERAAFEAMKARVGGLDRDGIAAVFRDLPGVAKVSVRLRPPWVRRAPSNPDHIKIEIQEE